MVKKFLACVMLLLVTVSGARAEMGIYTQHRSIAGLTDGHSDYSDARFLEFFMSVVNFDTEATEADMNLSGKITLSGGSYSFWNDSEMQKVSGTPQEFGLKFATWKNLGENIEYMLTTASGSEFSCGIESDNGLNGITASWNFPDKPSYNGQAATPIYRTTQEQLNSFVPYVEFIQSGSQVTGLKWRVVNPDDPSKPVPQDFGMSFNVNCVYNKYRDNLCTGPWDYVEPGNAPEGTVSFDRPIDESEIWAMRIYLIYDTDGQEQVYMWYFCKPSEPNSWLWQNHISDASLVGGKSDYGNAKFSSLYFDVRADEEIVVEAKHFMSAGKITIPGGGYSLHDDDTDEELGGVEAGIDKAYNLRMYRGVTLDDSYLEYQPFDDSGRNIAFSGGAEKGLNGKTITWTFQSDLKMDGSATVPGFKSTSEQLAEGAPYIEVISSDGNITALNYRIASASDTSTAITPPYRTDFKFHIRHVSGSMYRSAWQKNTASGTFTLPEPLSADSMKYIIVRLRKYEDSENPAVYQWNFYPVEPEDAPVVIASEDLPPAATGQPYSHSLKASGDPASWRVTSGVLPGGLTLSSDGVISGTVSTDAIESNAESGRVYSFGITAESAAKSDTKTFSITVYQPVRIITEALPDAKEGEEYYAEIEAEGTRGAFTQNVNTTAPPGLEYSTSETGKITLRGTPSIAGIYSVAAVFANSWSTAEKSFTLTVEGKPASAAKPRITLPKIGDYLIAGKDYSFQFGTSGNAPVIWAVSGDVPAGLSFDASTGKLSGKAEAADEGKYSHSPMSYSFTVTATNSGGTDSANVYMKVYYPPEIVDSSLPNATLNAGYRAEITAEGTEQGMTWTASSMNLPEGLTLTTAKNNRKCTITGVPHEIGTSSFVLKLSNTAGSTSEKVFILKVSEASSEETGKPAISTQSLYNGEISVQYVAFLEAAGRKPITWSRSGGKLPKGLTLDSYGAIKGVPTKSGTYNFTVTATNSEGSSSQNFTIVITGGKYNKPKISTKKIPGATQNQPYSIQLECTGTNPVTWSLANSKQPSGIYVTEDGRITGIPKEAGKFRIKVKAENNIGTATRTFSLKVDGIAPKILTDDLPTGTKKVRYNAQLVADGTDPIKWSKSGSLPSGLKLNPKTGAITGKPRKADTYGFKVTAKNKYGKYQKSFVIIVTDEAQETSSTTSAVTEPSASVALDYSQEYSEPEIFPNHEGEIDLCVVSGDEELRGEIYAPEGKPLTFKIGAEAEDVEVYIADEAIALDVEDDGTFVLPGELVSDEFVIYAVSDGVKTIELYIVAEEE